MLSFAVIDRVYAFAMRVSMRFVDVCMGLYSTGAPVDESVRDEISPHEDILLNYSASEPHHESQLPTFKAVREVLRSYDGASVLAVNERIKHAQEQSLHAIVPVEVEENGEVMSSSKILTYSEKVIKSDDETLTQGHTSMYIRGTRVPVFRNPQMKFDAKIAEIPYGEMVTVIASEGGFYHIIWQSVRGWVLCVDIADRADEVYPLFVKGEEQMVDHTNTVRVRALIGDPFGLGRSEFPLQAGEYILYRLWRKGIQPQWPDVRPRVPGVWHKILKGLPKVHIGIVPKSGDVMEYTTEKEVGHLAFVEAVFPDETITISEVNFLGSGMYDERVLIKEEWKELRPLFLSIVS